MHGKENGVSAGASGAAACVAAAWNCGNSAGDSRRCDLKIPDMPSLHPILRIPRALFLADVDDLADVVGVVGTDVRKCLRRFL